MKNFKKMALLVLGSMFFFLLMTFHVLPISVAHAKPVTASPSSVTVERDSLPGVKLNVKSVNLVKGKTYPLKVYNMLNDCTISYKSSDNEVASISDQGVITGNTIGTALVTVTIMKGSKIVTSLTCDINVGVPAIYVRFTTSEVILTKGQTTTLKYLIAPYNTVENPRFTTLNSKIATISTGGRITAKTPGITFCYALVDKGISRCKVIVISDETNTALKKNGFEDLSKVTLEDLQEVNPDTYDEEPTLTPTLTPTPTPTITPTSTPTLTPATTPVPVVDESSVELN